MDSTVRHLKVYCDCRAHVWALDPQPRVDATGRFWRVGPHDRPDGAPCPERTLRIEIRPLTDTEIDAVPGLREQIAAGAREAAVRLAGD